MPRIEPRNGRWRARVWAPDGRERSRTFDRKADAERWAATQQADVARGQWVDPALGRMTFGEWVKRWEKTLVDLRPGTEDLNLRVVRLHLLPRFDGWPLARITHADVTEMVADDRRKGYSGSAVRRHALLLRQILAAAVADGRLGRNVAEGVRLPPESARPMRFLNPDQLTYVADTIRPQHYRPLVLTAGWVGLRWGELAGLRVDRIDFMRRSLIVDQQLVEIGGQPLQFGRPKTDAGVRRVTLPAAIADLLAEHQSARPVRKSGLMFPVTNGRPMRRGSFGRNWRRAVRECFEGTAWEGLVFHELRHTAAALAIAHGAHPLTIKTRLGHSSITVTMDRYGHLFPAQDEALAEAMDGTLRASLDRHPASTRPGTGALHVLAGQTVK